MAERLSVDVARENNEPLYGTIKAASVWLLLEYNGVYTNQAWDDARIPDEVKAKLDNFPDSRPLLIRQPEQINEIDRLISFFVVKAASDKPAIYHLKFASYDDILEIDLNAILAGEVVEETNEPLYVICTNGKRDVCCSKYGIALYNAMTRRAQHQVWQSSHIGGHRFAGTMYCFPHALCYGFLSEGDAKIVVQSYRHKQILLDKLRGHAIYDKPIQAAEYFLRRELNNDTLDAVKYLSHDANEDKWTVRFAIGDAQYKVNIATGTPIQALATTGDANFKDIPQYKFVDYHRI